MRIDIPGKGPIEFEGRKLSDAAKYFEIAPGYHDFPADSKKWILDLHYAWANGRHADSELILKTCRLIEESSQQSKSVLVDTIQTRFPEILPDEFLHHWFDDLAVIREVASRCEVCYWIIRPESGEADLFLKTVVKIITMNQGFEKSPKEFKDRLKSIPNASEAEKIKFILDFTDSYSDKR